MVLNEEQREEHYNPVMWCVPSSGSTHISRGPHLLLIAQSCGGFLQLGCSHLRNNSSHARKPSHVVQPSAPVVQATLSLFHVVETNAFPQVLKHGAVLFPDEYIATPQSSPFTYMRAFRLRMQS